MAKSFYVLPLVVCYRGRTRYGRVTHRVRNAVKYPIKRQHGGTEAQRPAFASTLF